MRMVTTLNYFIKRMAMAIGNPVKKSGIGKYVISLDTNESIQRSIYMGEFEPEETAWFYRIIKPGMIVVDVGSNVGYYSLISSALVGETGMVYSFDPSDYAFRKLGITIQENKIKNIKLHGVALGDHPEIRKLFLREPGLHSPSFCYDDEYTTESLGESGVITLDMFAEENDINHIDLVKIDVEGYEKNVILGMHRLLQQNRVRRIMVEFNGYWLKKTGSSSGELDALIRSYGFVLELKKEYECQPDEISIGNYMYVNSWDDEEIP